MAAFVAVMMLVVMDMLVGVRLSLMLVRMLVLIFVVATHNRSPHLFCLISKKYFYYKRISLT
jgi:hypothetical protein